MISMNDEAALATRYRLVRDALDERGRRLLLGAEAEAWGHGGVAAVARATGASESTVRRGRNEVRAIANGDSWPISDGGVRRPGGGRPSVLVKQPGLMTALKALVGPMTRGDPESALLWTTKSVRHLSAELKKAGFEVGRQVVSELLKSAGYSLQALSKTREGTDSPDRDAQFLFIKAEVEKAQANGQPVISVDTKKKELVGDFKNGGREWQKKGQPEPVRVHDFVDPQLGKAIPYGVYDITNDEGWVSVGINHDTAQFAVESIRRWYKRMGKDAYPNATELIVTADCGGSNSARTRAWKVELQLLALEIGLTIKVRHLPPGTSKWNKIEHRLFSHIAMNWRGRPLTCLKTIVSLIGNTTSSKGLRVIAELDDSEYAKGVVVPDKIMAELNIKRHEFRGEWNYDIFPSLFPDSDC